MPEINCDKCIRRKHCFVKEFEVLFCEDYKEETIPEEVKESTDV